MTIPLQSELDIPDTWDVVSECGQYRYVLGHRWASGPLLVFGLCNPSKATATKSDPTSRVCDGFARALGYAGRVIVNAAAYRATDSDELLSVADPEGPENATHQARVFGEATPSGPVFFGWGGALPPALRGAAFQMVVRAQAHGLRPMCIGLTRDGQPMHPLMKSYALPLQPFTMTTGA